jgi:pimeloyl-ACP methyl ester carboxylesterase
MPDRQFDGRRAEIQVHRVRPVYAHGKCRDVPGRAAVLVHGRDVPGEPTFDLRHPGPEGGTLSVQRVLAGAGIDSFAPSLLGYGRSTRFGTGLDDPGNAALRPAPADGACPYPEGCDRSNLADFRLDQQGTLLLKNPLGRTRSAHSSDFRFGRTDVWVRDIRQVIDDAIARARPKDGKVTLVGYSLGGQHVARTLYAANPVLPNSAAVIAKVDRAVFASSVFGTPTEEVSPARGFTSFPTNLSTRSDIDGAWAMPAARDAACTGHVVPGSRQRMWTQTMAGDRLGSTWGGKDPKHPTGVSRAPTFSSYGWSAEVAHRQTTPSLVIDGLEDRTPLATPADSRTLYSSLGTAHKVLVQVQCASHAMLWEGCSGPRCTPQSGTPYGGRPGRPWAGPRATVQAALIEWIRNGTFDHSANGRFTVNESGVANPAP